MECNITEGRCCLRWRGVAGGGLAVQDLNYNSWPRSSNESPANEAGARLTQRYRAHREKTCWLTPRHRRRRGLEEEPGARRLKGERRVVVDGGRSEHPSASQPPLSGYLSEFPGPGNSRELAEDNEESSIEAIRGTGLPLEPRLAAGYGQPPPSASSECAWLPCRSVGV
ncbi:hypothetical protein KM043_016437 [Ampulex compressa]|nr:hypothetical protein KM043_016437 [Ampulex compressa]